MNLDEITPLVLTFNEEDNLRSTLESLRWAKQILVVDSFSTDKTLEIASQFPKVKVVQRAFDHFADQCNYGIQMIDTNWVLSIDADYQCPEQLETEIGQLEETKGGYEAAFVYCIYGKKLRSCLYPPRIVLHPKHVGKYVRDGHAHRYVGEGTVSRLKTKILHDDWKPLSRWLNSQWRYAKDEAQKLLSTNRGSLGWKDRIRLMIVLAPPLTLLYCLFWRRLILDGWAGCFYTTQRVLAELVLSLELLDRKLRR